MMPSNPLDPGPDTEHRIRERAYHLWEADGCPHGRDGEYWERARELQAIADSAGAGTLPNPITHPTPGMADQVVEEAQIQENLGEFPHAGLRDQGDRAETPLVRGKARSILKMATAVLQDSPDTAARRKKS